MSKVGRTETELSDWLGNVSGQGVLVTRSRALTIAVAVLLVLGGAAVAWARHGHNWQQLHTWPQYDVKGCAAVYDGWKAMRRGDRDQALDRLAEAQWQYGHSNFIRDRASEVARVERRVRAGADLSVEALTTWHDLKPWQCYRG